MTSGIIIDVEDVIVNKLDLILQTTILKSRNKHGQTNMDLNII